MANSQLSIATLSRAKERFTKLADRGFLIDLALIHFDTIEARKRVRDFLRGETGRKLIICDADRSTYTYIWCRPESPEVDQQLWGDFQRTCDASGEAIIGLGSQTPVWADFDHDAAPISIWLRMLFQAAWQCFEGTSLRTSRSTLTPSGKYPVGWSREEWLSARELFSELENRKFKKREWPDTLPGTYFSVLEDAANSSITLIDAIILDPSRQGEIASSGNTAAGSNAQPATRVEPNSDDAAIIYHGGKVYSAPGSTPVSVSDNENNVLQAFLKNKALDTCDLKKTSGVDNAVTVLKRLQRRPSFAPYIKTPGGKNGGGYRVSIRRAENE